MRLIDADVLYAILKQRDKQLTGLFGDLGGAASGAAKLVLVQPTVDAVPVVRCKDCKWYGYYSCEMGGNNWMRDGNGFCDRGERKDGDQNG